MKEYGLYESASVKVRLPWPFYGIIYKVLTLSSQIQTFKTAIEAARMLLRVDDVVQATRKEREQGGGGGGGETMPEEMMEG